MNRKIPFALGEYYHLYNRGNNKQAIFKLDNDHRRFQQLLYLCNSDKSIVFKNIMPMEVFLFDRGDTLIDIGAYCLMPNHFHILVKEKRKRGISVFMQKLATAYSMYFNKLNERTGKLFEGAFKSTHVDDDAHLRHLFAYIHLNPLGHVSKQLQKHLSDHEGKEKLQISLNQFPFSSYKDYMESRTEGRILSRESFPSYFTCPEDFLSFSADWFYEKI